ncbi:MAG: carboxypeptidase-like regulatory domain-containing protein [Nostocaceae cyanobacterium]|nr:carboxypeptidase-like regulatory domain-containing protein [Nostocaceae cyanobacterium]
MTRNPQVNYIGRVIDQYRQAPISRAKITLTLNDATPIVTYTDLEGIYRFTVNYRERSSIQGTLTIEADGYRIYESSIRLSPDKNDLGDIRLLDENAPLTDTIPTSIIIAVIMGFIIIALLLLKSSSPKKNNNQQNYLIHMNIAMIFTKKI